MKKLDGIIIIVVLLVSLLGFLYLQYGRDNDFNNKKAEIYIDGELYNSYELTEDIDEEVVINTELGTNIIKLYNNGVNIIDADCPDKYCVSDGFINEPGEMLVCLPNKVVVEIKGEKESTIDDTSY
ncbi:NusG domain II-containing protein [Clostridium sp. D2Q-11]|uniref:NusG domain II-containing protein n=1 Tax=Anaeromonas frigoriresistens TaxID=2683708 RepID=A0A942V2P5_9FIRM|nr:NusG domain II-containing protein [Anaeromonas frigoriresistens]MBS4538877.1 NusG domain II-containing protein [Anaeromonas frigoriresistens]